MWTYDPVLLAGSAMMQVRWLIGDTVPKDQQLQDEEIVWAMSQQSNIYGAASECCLSLAARFSREADTSQGPLRTSYSTRARAYAARAGALEVKAMVRSAGLPYGGGLSQMDREMINADPDRIAPAFSLGMDENFLPNGIVGNETGRIP